jgi:dihydrofolate synthase/folylpolyglutamate synthase
VVALLSDKEIEAVAAAVDCVVDRWLAAGLDGPRTLPAAEFAARIRAAPVRAPLSVHPSVAEALAHADAQARPGDRIVVFGSFRTVEAALRHLDIRASARAG